MQKIDGKYFVYKDFGRNNTNILLTEWLKYIQDFGIDCKKLENYLTKNRGFKVVKRNCPSS